MINKKEIWKPIKNYEKQYEVSNCGRIKSLRRKIILKFYIATGNYKKVDLFKDDKKVHYSIHRLVAQAFIPNPKNKPQVNHKDGIVSNNHYMNLEWVTPSENAIHASMNGLLTYGKLTHTQVTEIKLLLQTKMKQTAIARLYPFITSNTIMDIKRQKSWSHLKV